MAGPRQLTINVGQSITVEMTDNLCLKLIDPETGDWMFINTSNEEIQQFREKVFQYFEVKGMYQPCTKVIREEKHVPISSD